MGSRWFGRILCVLLLTGMLDVVAVAAPLFESTLGVSHHFTLDSGQDGKDIERTRSVGFHLLRYDLTWSTVERQKGQYDFQVFDRLAGQMTGKGIRPLFILVYGNPLYGDALSVRTEEARTAFARFAAAAASRYKGKGVIWELWNEPNNTGFWEPHPDVYEYMKLVIDAATEIRLADPDAYIVAPGTARIDFAFLEICMKLGLLRYVDAVSVHPYRDEPPETVLVEYERLRSMIRKYQPPGQDVPIVVSEWGYSTSAFGGDEQMQARYLSRLFLLNASAGIDFTVWYDFRNDGREPRNYEHNFGWLRQDGTDKPAVKSAHMLAQQLGGRRFSRRLGSLPADYLLEFMDARGKPCLAAWTVGNNHSVAISGQGIVGLTPTPQFVGCR